MLSEFLAYQREEQAHAVTELSTVDEARLFLFALAGRTLPQVCITFGLVDYEFEAEHTGVVAHARLQLKQAAPEIGILILIQNPFEECHEHRSKGMTFGSGIHWDGRHYR